MMLLEILKFVGYIMIIGGLVGIVAMVLIDMSDWKEK